MIPCCIELHGSSIPYFIAGHILRTLLKNCGVESECELDEHITEQLSEDSSQYLYLLNDVICLNVSCRKYKFSKLFFPLAPCCQIYRDTE